MAGEEAETEIVIEGGVIGVKKATRFSPLVNFKFEIIYFMENIDIGNFLYILISNDIVCGLYVICAHRGCGWGLNDPRPPPSLCALFIEIQLHA